MATTPFETTRNTKPIDTIDAVQRITRRIDSIGERDDGVIGGLSWYYLRLIMLTGIGWALDAMETLVFVYVGTLIAQDIAMGPHQTSFLAGSVFIGSFFGSFLAGSLADSYGRRPIFIATVVVFLVGLSLCGASWDVTSLTCFRIISGVGLGGELPVVSTLVQELSPQKTRGKIIVLLEAFWAIGGMLAVIVAFYVTPHVGGWRNTFYLLCIPVVYSILIRFMIPESPKWLASVGRWDEAVAIVEGMEGAHCLTAFEEDAVVVEGGGADCAPLPPVSSARVSDTASPTYLDHILLLFRPPFMVRTAVLWTLWFGISLSYYGIFVFLPDLVSRKGGYDINAKPERMLIIIACQLPGYFSAAVMVEWLGRRLTLVLFLFGSFVSAIAFAYVPPEAVRIMVSGSTLSFFLLGAWGCVYAYTPENYPTAIRGIGAAYPAGFSRIGAFWGPYLCHDFLQWGMSIQAVMWVFGTVLCGIGAIVLLFGFEPLGKNVEDYAETEEEKRSETRNSNGMNGDRECEDGMMAKDDGDL